jgi:hypothetical protein
MTKNSDPRRTLKDIYKNSCERISLALKLYGPAAKDAAPKIQETREYETIHNLINSVVSSQKFEEENDYRSALQDTGTWILSAYKKSYFEANAKHAPSILYVVKRGLEVLHALLHPRPPPPPTFLHGKPDLLRIQIPRESSSRSERCSTFAR